MASISHQNYAIHTKHEEPILNIQIIRICSIKVK